MSSAKSQPVKIHKTFNPNDEIPCKSVTPWKLTAVGVDKTLYIIGNILGY